MVKQVGEQDCGVAALAMIINYYKGAYPLEELRNLTCTTRQGTTAYNIVDAAIKIGFDANCYRCSLEDINSNNIILPCIANVIIEKKYKHFLVIYEIDFKNEKIIIADPADRIKKISFSSFKKIFNNYLIMLFPTKVIPVLEHNKVNYKYFYDMIKKEKKTVFKIAVSSLFITLLAVISSFYIEYLVNAISISSSKKYLLNLFIIFSLVYLLKNIFEYERNKMLAKIKLKLDSIITLDTYNNILSLPYIYYRNHTTGDIISRINDLSNVKDLIAKFFLIVIVDIPLTLFAFVFMFCINKILSLLALSIIIAYLLIIRLYKKILDDYIFNLKKSKSDITSSMIENISGFETVKGLKIKKYVYDKFKNMYSSFLILLYNYQKSYLKESMYKNIISDLGFVIIMFLGFSFVLSNKITLGSLFTFNALIIYFLEPLKSILSMDSEIKEAKCSYKRIIELNISKKEEETNDNHFKGNIQIKNLSYTFDNEKDILKNINLTIDAGEKVMVLGPSGSGKSTLFKMLLKYYEIENNKIFIDNSDINTIHNSSKIKYINQIETLFTDTLYNNLTMGNNLSKDEIDEIINICYLDKIINRDSLGINQMIEENGFNLSGGERQRIVLARTLLQDFDILIIDEGLNQVDISLERKILNNLKVKYKDKTIIVISHRLNNKDMYDKVVKLKKGRLLTV